MNRVEGSIVTTGESAPLRSSTASIYSEQISAATTSVLSARFGRRLRSVVLTGSLARNEATWHRLGNRVRLTGDAEFLLVFDRRRSIPSNAEIASAQDYIQQLLLDNGIEVKIDLGAITPRFFEQLQPHIFAYELQVYGKTIWGEEIRVLAPTFTAAEISLEDGFRILMNRIVELLESLAEATTLRPLPQSVRHRSTKLCLDMVTSLLVFLGSYEPSYAKRLRSISRGFIGPDELSVLRPRLLQRTIMATRWKLGEDHREPIVTLRELNDLIGDVHLLWQWELRVLNGDTPSPDNNDTLIDTWCSREHRFDWLRSWASTVRRCRPAEFFTSFPRWIQIAHRGSPRRLIYVAASQLFLAAPEVLSGGVNYDSTRWQHLAAGLPYPGPLEHIRTWEAAAAAATRNYHRFLEDTRA